MPPKNKYPQYRRSDFDNLTYGRIWANHRRFIVDYDKALFADVMSVLGENPMEKYIGRGRI